MKRYNIREKLVLAATTLFLVVGCSGDDGIEGSGEKPKVDITGTAATGAPLANAQIIAKGANGVRLATSTNDLGDYEINVAELKGPYLLQAERNDGPPLYSIASSNGVINIHPITDLIIRNWFKVRGYDVENEFDRNDGAIALPTVNQINDIKSAIGSILATSLLEYTIAVDFDLFSSPFTADSTGFDRYLDNLSVEINYERVNIEINSTNNMLTVEASIIRDVDLATDFTVIDAVAPNNFDGVQILPGSSGLVVAWNETTDNIAVAGYRIYKDGSATPVATTTFPLYSDTNLAATGPYCYQIEAFDGAGNTTALTPEECITALPNADGEVPSTPQAPTAFTSGSNSVVLQWLPATDNTGVLAYDVFRGPTGNVNTQLATTVATGYTDNNAGSTDCYTIAAFDAARNTSARSAEFCPNLNADTTAPTTTANPVGGDFATSKLVQLNCDDGIQDSGCDITYYTFDALTDPNPIWNVYTGPIAITSTSTLRFYSVDNAGNAESDTANSETYTLPENNPGNGGGTGESSVGFSQTAYMTSESSAALLVSVTRSGNLDEAISVDFASTDGTATANMDYLPVSGTLTWAANDASAKTFLLPIKADTVANDGQETVVLNLSNASTNTTLANTSSTVTIADATCTGILSSNVTVSTTITEACTLVTRNISVNNGATLSISPGVTLVFQASAGINVASDGALSAIGTVNQPILFTAEQPTPGYWEGIQFTFSNNINNAFDYVTIEYGGGAGGNGNANVVMFGGTGNPQRLKISNTTLSHSLHYGFEFDGGSILDVFANNTMTNNTDGPGLLPANIVGQLDAASSYSGNSIDELNVQNGGVAQAQTWKLINVPYSVGSHSISADLSIEAGATLIFRANGSLNVGSAGSLSAIGTANNMITFTADQPTRGFWDGIQFTFSNNINNQLDYAIVEYGGGAGGNGNANIVMFGGTGNTQRLKLSNSILRHSLGYGFEFDSGSEVDLFENNVITNNQSAAGRIPANRVSVLDVNSIYSGNDLDVIYVENGTISTSQTWPYIDADYSTGNLSVTNQLSVAAGSTLIFRSGGRINIDSAGALTADGTATSVITFTAEQASPGFWNGIQFTFSNNINNVLNNVVVEYGGAGINGQGNVMMFGGTGNPQQATITNSLFQFSSSYGIWLDTGSQVNIDITTSNQFSMNTLGTIFGP